MRFYPLPILVLPLALAHADPLRPSHHGRRASALSRGPSMPPDGFARRAATTSTTTDGGLLTGLLGGSTDSTGTSSTMGTTAPDPLSAVTSSSQVTTSSPIETTPIPPTTNVLSSISSTSTSTVLSSTAEPSNNTHTSSSAIVSPLNATSTPVANVSSAAVASPSSMPLSSSTPAGTPVVTMTTDPAGQTSIVTLYYTASASSTLSVTASSSASVAAASNTGSRSAGGSISVGAIVGISVGVGIMILSLIGCALWRMKRRTGDNDDVIRWPELNRHGDSDAHHALPAKKTGKHGIETSPLERSSSNSSSIFPSATPPADHAAPMALNGSSFGAASSLEDYDEKDLPEYGDHEDYTSLPPLVALQPTVSTSGAGAYDADSDEMHETAGPQASTFGQGGAAYGRYGIGE